MRLCHLIAWISISVDETMQPAVIWIENKRPLNDHDLYHATDKWMHNQSDESKLKKKIEVFQRG